MIQQRHKLGAGASEASEETKLWRGKRLFVNNGLLRIFRRLWLGANMQGT